MSKIMIMSLGGSPEPLTKSIETHRPQHIIFLASQDSLLKAGKTDVDAFIDFVTALNEFINHEPKPFSKISDTDMVFWPPCLQ